MLSDMFDRARLEREIRVNAALVLQRPADELVITVAPNDDAFIATIGVADTTLRARGATENEALWQLLTDCIDRTFGKHPLVMTPQLEAAIRLLRMTRRELIEEIRRELDAAPLAPDRPPR